MPHRAIVLGTESWIAARALAAWLGAGHQVAEVWCCGPETSLLRRCSGGGSSEWSARRILARRRIPVVRRPPLAAWPDAQRRAADVGADVLLTLMSLQLVPRSLLEHFGARALNVHPALLPRYRGMVPRLAMLVDGAADRDGGVTVHVLTAGIDEGPIVGQAAVPYDARRGYADWDARLAVATGTLVTRAVVPYLAGERAAVPQDAARAGYRRAGPGELEIGAATSLEQARRLGAALGATGRLVCRHPAARGGRGCHVTGVAGVVGLPTGAGVRIGVRTVELDIADARVRLLRRSPADRIREAIAARLAVHRQRSACA